MLMWSPMKLRIVKKKASEIEPPERFERIKSLGF